MLTPQQILEITDTLYPVIDELNTWITNDMIKRIMARIGRGKAFLTATDDWQLQVYQAAGGHLEAVQQEIARWTKLADNEIQRIFEDAGIKAISYDSDFYVEHGLEPLSLNQSEGMIRLLEDAYQRTAGTVHNFTRTTAQASQQRLMKVLDEAYFKVSSGAASYTQAVKEAVDDVASVQTKVRYSTGHVDTIETAVLRAVRTGVSQASGNMAIEGMNEREWDLIRVSAHLGARYGDGGENPGNHFWWQGKLYSRTGKTPGYPLFEECTGFGTGEGLCGWNCRHSFGPGDPDHNPFQDYDAEENKKAYELSQKQRAMERAIRRSKTELLGYRTAIENCTDPEEKAALQQEYDATALRLKRQNAAYDQFCKENNLQRYDDRLRVAKWNRSEAAKAAWAAQKYKIELGNREKYDKMVLEIKSSGNLPASADIHIPPQRVDVHGLSFDDTHINAQRGHNVTREQAEAWIQNAKMSATVWGGKYERYYGSNGCAYVGTVSKDIRTAFSSDEFDDNVRAVMEVLKKYDIL